MSGLAWSGSILFPPPGAGSAHKLGMEGSQQGRLAWNQEPAGPPSSSGSPFHIHSPCSWPCSGWHIKYNPGYIPDLSFLFSCLLFYCFYFFFLSQKQLILNIGEKNLKIQITRGSWQPPVTHPFWEDCHLFILFKRPRIYSSGPCSVYIYCSSVKWYPCMLFCDQGWFICCIFLYLDAWFVSFLKICCYYN